MAGADYKPKSFPVWEHRQAHAHAHIQGFQVSLFLFLKFIYIYVPIKKMSNAKGLDVLEVMLFKQKGGYWGL